MPHYTAKPPTNGKPHQRLCLSPDDQAALKELNKKLQIIRDLVVSVVKKYTTGLILTGRGGTGKSWTVIEELKRLKADYDLHNSHMTARGLFEELSAKPDSIHVIEDNESLFRDQKALGVLRSATWATLRDDKGRPVRHLFCADVSGVRRHGFQRRHYRDFESSHQPNARGAGVGNPFAPQRLGRY